MELLGRHPGDMTLYAKWVTGRLADTATAAATVPGKPTESSTEGTPTAVGTTAQCGTIPTMTQAPSAMAGLLFGTLTAALLLRRRA